MKICNVVGCNKKPRPSGSVCPMHYHRMYRTGTYDLLPVAPKGDDITGARFGTLVVLRRAEAGQWLTICDCGQTRVTYAWNLRHQGATNTCGLRRNHRHDVGYYGMHQRLNRDRGPAREHDCADCGASATHWSYDRADEPRYDGGLPYSLDPDRYQARCTSCHKAFDLAKIRQVSR